ncbi:hypothetical protein JCM24511_03994 [Saitozyma sp. JCM 24511]|nr:hypothetical protein JCM24511_03994 [Saitozyma sp. JCM 24511]
MSSTGAAPDVGPSTASTASASARSKRRRVTCSPGLDGDSCSRCEEYGVTCTYDRPAKRRGPQLRRHPQDDDPLPGESADPSQPVQADLNGFSTSPTSAAAIAISPVSQAVGWMYEEVVDSETVEYLVDVFHRTAYPIRPYFHWPSFTNRIRQQLYQTDRDFFAVVMAVCAMAAGTLRDGASMPPGIQQRIPNPAGLGRRCYQAAVKAIPRDLTRDADPCQVMKAKALMISICLQSGDTRVALAHMGDYATLSAINGFHLEGNWPSHITEIEKQERRRLYWGVYQMDQYISSTFGLVPRHREAQTTVLYPAEVVDDEDITERDVRLPRSNVVTFFRGWNFCSDLYRVIEHVTGQLRGRQTVPSDEPGSAITSFLARSAKLDASEAQRLILRLHEDLPAELKTVKQMTGNPQTDRLGFIAANILITTQNLKMLVASVDNASVHVRCAIAGELLDELSTIPTSYIHASSTTTLHHLAGVGHLLGSVIHKPLSTWTYLQVRNILLVLADFLAKMESGRAAAAGLSTRLRSQISRIDRFMAHTARDRQDPSLLSMGDSLLSSLPVNTEGDDSHQDQSPARTFLRANAPSIAEPLDEAPVVPPRTTVGAGGGLPPMNPPPMMSSFGGSHHDMDPSIFDIIQLSTAPQIPAANMPLNQMSGALPDDFFNSWPFQFDQADALDFIGGMPALDKRPATNVPLDNQSIFGSA